MTPVILTPPTQQCLDNRADPELRCFINDNNQSSFLTDASIYGSPLGACGTAPQALQKGYVKGLQQLMEDPSRPKAMWSPAYDVLKNYQLTDFQMTEIYQMWTSMTAADPSLGPRDATCQWVVDNFALIQSWVPEGFPRVIEKHNFTKEGRFVGAMCVACLAMGMLAICMGVTFARRNTKVIYYTQQKFLNLMQFGLISVAAAACLVAIVPREATCKALPFLENIGYSFALVPLVVRLYSINKLFASGKQMR